MVRWWDSHAGLVPILASMSGLGLLQGLVLLGLNRNFPGGAGMVLALLALGLISGLLSILLLCPGILFLRRFHPSWRQGDRFAATWSLCATFGAGIAAWMLVDVWGSGPLIAQSLEPWLESLAVLLAGLIAWFAPPPPKGLLRVAALATIIVVVFTFVAIVAGLVGSVSDQEPLAVRPPSDKPDVILVSIDTLRADRLSAYGETRALTPEIDRLASEGVVFDRVLASSPWTVPSVASMLTGLPTIRHGAGMPFRSGLTFLRSPLDEKHSTIAERFAAAGYRTRAVVANGFLGEELGFGQGFETYENPMNAVMGALVIRDLPIGRLLLSLIPVQMVGDYRAEGVTQRALEWLDETDPSPLFLWVHYIDPHMPYQADPASLDLAPLFDEFRQMSPPVQEDGTVVGEAFAAISQVRSGILWLGPEDRRRIEDYYDRGVRYADAQIGRLIETIKKRTEERQVIVALTSDHGEEFWDHGHFEHGHDYYREVTQVPLIFWAPGLVPEGRRVETPVGLVDVGPTLLELAGLEVQESALPDEGRSLQGLWDGSATGEDIHPPRFAGGNLYDLPAVLIEEGPWRFILRANGEQELYNVLLDPDERDNRALEQTDLAARYRRLLEPRLSALLWTAGGQLEDLSPEMLKSLESLGYVR